MAAYGNECFVMGKVYCIFLSWKVISLTPKRYHVNTEMLHSMMASALSGARTRDFDPEAVWQASPTFSYGSPLLGATARAGDVHMSIDY